MDFRVILFGNNRIFHRIGRRTRLYGNKNIIYALEHAELIGNENVIFEANGSRVTGYNNMVLKCHDPLQSRSANKE
jgi:hypothetical protein